MLSNWLREQTSVLEKTEELLVDINAKIRRVSTESSEGGKIPSIRNAIATLQKELTEMDQRR